MDLAELIGKCMANNHTASRSRMIHRSLVHLPLNPSLIFNAPKNIKNKIAESYVKHLFVAGNLKKSFKAAEILSFNISKAQLNHWTEDLLSGKYAPRQLFRTTRFISIELLTELSHWNIEYDKEHVARGLLKTECNLVYTKKLFECMGLGITEENILEMCHNSFGRISKGELSSLSRFSQLFSSLFDTELEDKLSRKIIKQSNLWIEEIINKRLYLMNTNTAALLFRDYLNTHSTNSSSKEFLRNAKKIASIAELELHDIRASFLAYRFTRNKKKADRIKLLIADPRDGYSGDKNFTESELKELVDFYLTEASTWLKEDNIHFFYQAFENALHLLEHYEKERPIVSEPRVHINNSDYYEIMAKMYQQFLEKLITKENLTHIPYESLNGMFYKMANWSENSHDFVIGTAARLHKVSPMNYVDCIAEMISKKASSKDFTEWVKKLVNKEKKGNYHFVEGTLKRLGQSNSGFNVSHAEEIANLLFNSGAISSSKELFEKIGNKKKLLEIEKFHEREKIRTKTKAREQFFDFLEHDVISEAMFDKIKIFPKNEIEKVCFDFIPKVLHSKSEANFEDLWWE